jgi:hypothetical protein
LAGARRQLATNKGDTVRLVVGDIVADSDGDDLRLCSVESWAGVLNAEIPCTLADG